MGSYEQLFFFFLFVFWCKKEKGNEGRGGGVWNVTWGYVGSMKGLILTSINSSIPTTGTRSNASRRAILISAIERPSVLLPRMWDHVLLSLLSPPPPTFFLNVYGLSNGTFLFCFSVGPFPAHPFRTYVWSAREETQRPPAGTLTCNTLLSQLLNEL